jgi:hypothetical protein
MALDFSGLLIGLSQAVGKKIAIKQIVVEFQVIEWE